MLGKKLVALVVTGGIMLALVVPTMAQDATTTPEPTAIERVPLAATTDLFVTSEYFRVNVRSGPATIYTTIGTLTFADSVDMTGKNTEEADWLRVNFNGQEGWVFANVVEVTGDLETVPVVEASAPVIITDIPLTEEIELDIGDVVVTTLYNTNLRSTFSTDADVLEIVPFDTSLLPEGRTDDNNWLMVTVEDQPGWIYAPILFFASGDVETLPVLATVPEEVVSPILPQ